MRIGVISDTHITDKTKDLPKEIYTAFKNVDLILHAGDLVDLTVLKKLKTICKDVKAVYGNMDSPEVKSKLCEKEIIQIGKFKIALIHGWGNPAKLIEALPEKFTLDKPDIIVFGHSHYPVNEKYNGILFFNPGSLMDKIFAPFNSYGIIEINDSIKTEIIKV